MVKLRILHRFIIVGFLFLCLALFYYQIIKFSKYRQLSQANRIRILPQSASRGCILDRNGNLLAGNTLSHDLLIMPQEGGWPEGQISKLSQILSVSETELKSKYKKGYTTSFIPVLLYRDISLPSAIAVGQQKYDLPEVIIQARPKRTYPSGRIASHILGYLSYIDAWRLERLKEYGYKIQDLVGCSGIEQVYDYILHAGDGGKQVEVDSKGRLSRVLGYKAPQKGGDIELTIDLRLQKIIHKNLKGHSGCVVVLDPVNGDILALVSYPDFDPQVFQEGSPSLLKPLLNDLDAPLFNRATNGLYPPGSVFKIVVAAAGLEKKKINPNTKFFCSGNTQIGNRLFSCWGWHGEQDLVDALAHSCNNFFYNSGLQLGPQLINEYALKFGLSQLTGIDLTSESAGSLPYSLWQRIKKSHRWYDGDTANISIGQGGIIVTPLQIARMFAVLANDGKLIKPRLLKSVKQGNRIINLSFKPASNIPISKGTLRIIREGLFNAVEDPEGTAKILADLKISVAGKTGTAQVQEGRAHGWFAGYFPTDKPKFVICVFLEHVGTGYYCCQLTKRIIQQMLDEGLL